MKDTLFHFKKFSMYHSRSAMKIGVDAVILGAWGGNNINPSRILDVGCGCGIISIMLAQRFNSSEIIGIDSHIPSVDEAFKNGQNSPWANRLKFYLGNGCEPKLKGKFDLIISNPPYFYSGVSMPDTPRELARHAYSLNPFSLIYLASKILSESGTLAMIYPYSYHDRVVSHAYKLGLNINRKLTIHSKITNPPIRIICELGFVKPYYPVMSEISIMDESRNYTEEYKNLTKDFYNIF